MKKVSFLWIGLLLGSLLHLAHAQSPSGEVSSLKLAKCSPQTAILLMDWNKARLKEGGVNHFGKALQERYGLKQVEGQWVVAAFMALPPEASEGDLAPLGIKYFNKIGEFYTAQIPLNRLAEVIKSESVRYLQVSTKVTPSMTKSREATNTNQVHSGLLLPRAFKGEGVITGLVDVGLDYTHPNFYDSTGQSNYRIKQVWAQADTGSPRPAAYSYGRELKTESTILAAQRDLTNQTHASHVAGIMAGAGGGQSTDYVGMAPKSDLVYVGTTLNDADVMDGLAYIFNYADSVQKPCVVNLSLGSHIGPHDGTSIFDQMVDSLVGEGRIVIGAAGNEGAKRIHLGKEFLGNDSLVRTLVHFPGRSNRTNGESIIDIWANTGEQFSVRVGLFNTQTNSFEDQTNQWFPSSVDTSYDFYLVDQDTNQPDTCWVQLGSGINPINNKPNIGFYFENRAQDDDYRYVVIEIKSHDAKVHMWAYGGDGRFEKRGLSSPFQDGSFDYTVGEVGGSGKNTISVGAANVRTEWQSYSQGPRTRPGTIGQKASFSSMGPMVDGRIKPDVMAPGETIISSYNSFIPGYTGYTNYNITGRTQFGSHEWWYGVMAGTSMAAPAVAGIIALWMEMYPDLTPTQAKALMALFAMRDSITGPTPNNTWGEGRMNAWVNVRGRVPARPQIVPDTVDFCAGTNGLLVAPANYAHYEWNTGDTGRILVVSSAGTYRVRVSDSLGFHSAWSEEAVVRVWPSPNPNITQNGDTLFTNTTGNSQWYLNGQRINGATEAWLIPQVPGLYKVRVTNEYGCMTESSEYAYNVTNIPTPNTPLDFAVYPNPVQHVLYLKPDFNASQMTYSLYDGQGRRVMEGRLKDIKGGREFKIELPELSSGLYQLRLFRANRVYGTKVLVAPK